MGQGGAPISRTENPKLDGIVLQRLDCVRRARGRDRDRQELASPGPCGPERRAVISSCQTAPSRGQWIESQGASLSKRDQNRRAAPRVSADIHPSVPDRVNFIADDIEGSGQILNVSASGAFVAGPSHILESGTEVELYFLQLGTGRRLHAQGRVMRREASGFAVQFTSIERELERLVLSAARRAKNRE